jgi:hypothetical protein
MKSLITVEVKEKSLTLEGIYQAKLYKEVFEAKDGCRYAFSYPGRIKAIVQREFRPSALGGRWRLPLSRYRTIQ